MDCKWCDCEIPEGEEQYTDMGEGPLCDDCYEEAEAENLALRFQA